MKIVLAIPPKVDRLFVHREDKHVSFHDFPFVPYTAPLLYALIEKYIPKADINIIEAQRDDLDLKDVLEKIDQICPDIVICLVAWCAIPEDRKVAETKYPTISIILQQWIDQHEAIELYKLTSKYFLKREIEQPLIDGLLEFQETGQIINTKGFLIYEYGAITDTGDAEPADITEFPIPNFQAFNLEKYFKLRELSEMPTERIRMGYINSMKGCPFKCAFCGQSNKGDRVRYQSVDQVLEQLTILHDEYGVRFFEFIDNEFSVDLERAKTLCREIIHSNLGINFSIQDRMGYYDDEFITLLYEAGCREVRIGVETCDPKLQAYLNKNLDLTRYKQDIKKLIRKNINVKLYMTPGIPGETKKSLKMNAKFIAETGIDKFTSGPLFLMPNTPLYKKMKRENKLLVYDWAEYRKRDKLCYINTSYSSMKEILHAEKYMKRQVYFHKIKFGLANGKVDFISLLKLIITTSLGKKMYKNYTFLKKIFT